MSSRNKITEEQTTAAYEIAKRVFNSQIKADEGSFLLHTDFGLNQTTAKNFIDNYKHLLQGTVYKRSMSISQTRYFIERIIEEQPEPQKSNAVSALRKHIEYYEQKSKTNRTELRKLLEELSSLLDQPSSLEEFEKMFNADVDKAIQSLQEERLARLANANSTPEKVTLKTAVFVRNPDVVAETLFRAQGKCEECGKDAPFLRAKDGSPYLEIHHRIPLSSGGEDTVENAMAVCPNCHRKLHFGSIQQ